MEKVPKDCCSGIFRGTLRLRAQFVSNKADRDCKRNNRLVWDETSQVMTDLFDHVWGDSSEIVVDQFLDITVPVCIPMVQICPYTDIFTSWRFSSSVPQVVYVFHPYWLYDNRY
jgi:hypothetical protein